MPRGRRKKRTKPYYDLSEIRRLISEGKFRIRDNALKDARDDFGWNPDEILGAIEALQLKYFHKTEASLQIRGRMLDFYRARGLKGENIYTHFYINNETGFLIINSFKELL